MLKIFEEYIEDSKKKIESLNKIHELSFKIIDLYKMVFSDLNYIFSSPKLNNYRIIFSRDKYTEYIFKCELSLSESMINRNNYSVNIQLDWNIFVDYNNKDKCKLFYNFLRPIISPGGFQNIPISDIDELMSKINIDDYNLLSDTITYNL